MRHGRARALTASIAGVVVALTIVSCDTGHNARVDILGDVLASGASVTIDSLGVYVLSKNEMARDDEPLIFDAKARGTTVVLEWLYRSGDSLCAVHLEGARKGAHEVRAVFPSGDSIERHVVFDDYNVIKVSGARRRLEFDSLSDR